MHTNKICKILMYKFFLVHSVFSMGDLSPAFSSDSLQTLKTKNIQQYKSLGLNFMQVAKHKYLFNLGGLAGFGVAMADWQGTYQSGEDLRILALMLIGPAGSIYHTYELGRVGELEHIKGFANSDSIKPIQSIQENMRAYRRQVFVGNITSIISVPVAVMLAQNASYLPGVVLGLGGQWYSHDANKKIDNVSEILNQQSRQLTTANRIRMQNASTNLKYYHNVRKIGFLIKLSGLCLFSFADDPFDNDGVLVNGISLIYFGAIINKWIAPYFMHKAGSEMYLLE